MSGPLLVWCRFRNWNVHQNRTPAGEPFRDNPRRAAVRTAPAELPVPAEDAHAGEKTREVGGTSPIVGRRRRRRRRRRRIARCPPRLVPRLGDFFPRAVGELSALPQQSVGSVSIRGSLEGCGWHPRRSSRRRTPLVVCLDEASRRRNAARRSPRDALSSFDRTGRGELFLFFFSGERIAAVFGKRKKPPCVSS